VEAEEGSQHKAGWVVQCPACGFGHNFQDTGWKFDGDEEYPTFTPSMKVVIRREGEPVYICHATVKNGKIHYHNDSTHAHAGKVIKLEIVECPPPTKPSLTRL
jgi:hypothetical protein